VPPGGVGVVYLLGAGRVPTVEAPAGIEALVEALGAEAGGAHGEGEEEAEKEKSFVHECCLRIEVRFFGKEEDTVKRKTQ